MVEKQQPAQRRKRADGELSRERILDAATEIAAERGYEGTSIGLVSKKCGLPASSIYWHFKDKDDLIAAVIERSFGEWLSAWQLPERRRRTGTVRGRGGANRQGTARLPRLHPPRVDARAGAPPRRAARQDDVPRGPRPAPSTNCSTTSPTSCPS